MHPIRALQHAVRYLDHAEHIHNQEMARQFRALDARGGHQDMLAVAYRALMDLVHGGGHPQGRLINRRLAPQYVLPGQRPAVRGNIDIRKRLGVRVPNPYEGGYSSVYASSIGTPKGEVLIPQVVHRNGRWQVVDLPTAVRYYRKTGKNLGTFQTIEQANRYARLLHRQQARGR